ncbi:hypothetical protein [Acidisphaera sp. L21]|uniref:hypothetical protein n=1 Tax=Acidisphaera sp. L21 TaxID=1641851 RepID=UPI00131E4C6C|nr:hypothetical protein [Acidisphaera sp. L21]
MPQLRLANPPATDPRVAPPRFDRHRTSRNPAAAASPTSPQIDAETIIARLEEAGHTLLCLPRTGPTTALRQTRHQYVAEALEAFTTPDTTRASPSTPPPIRITRMDQALAWIPLIPPDRLVLRRIVGCRCLVSPLTGRHLFSWRRLARLLGADHKAIQRWHATGIDLIATSLNRDAALVRAWDRLR